MRAYYAAGASRLASWLPIREASIGNIHNPFRSRQTQSRPIVGDHDLPSDVVCRGERPGIAGIETDVARSGQASCQCRRQQSG